MLFKKLFITVVALFFLNAVLLAQIMSDNEAIKFVNLSIKEGLSQSSVLSLYQDQKGYMWAGTRDGLNRYDGVDFLKFRYSSRDSNSLSQNVVKAICEDEHGGLWIGTENGLNKYNEKTKGFQRIWVSSEMSTEANQITSLCAADNGAMWVGTIKGLHKIGSKNGEQLAYTRQAAVRSKLSKSNIQALFRGKDGQLWICTSEGVECFNPSTDQLMSYKFPSEGSNANFIASVYEDKDQNIWLGFNGGLALWNKSSKVFEYFRIGNRFIKDPVRSIQEDRKGNLWVGTYNGLYILDVKSGILQHYSHNENNSNSLSQNSIYSICRDKKGDMWLGTYFGGINYYSHSYNRFKNVTAGNNNRYLNYKVVSSILEDDNENLWIGTEGGGINFYNKATGIFNYYTHSSTNPHSISADNVKCMIMDKTDGLWIGLHDGGLNYLDTKNKPYRFLKIERGGNNIPLSNNRIVSLLQDVQDNIWIGTSGGGLNRLNPKTKEVTAVIQNKADIGNIVYMIAQSDSKDKIYIGSNIGLAELNLNTLQSNKIPFNKSTLNSSPNISVLSVCKDKEGLIWVGTEGDGLYCYNLNSKESQHYGMAEGLPNDVVYSVLRDEGGNLWLSTNNGLTQFNPKTNTFKTYDDSDGLHSKEFNYGASLQNNKGVLYFGGTNGFSYFNPKNVTNNTYVPPVFITTIKVNNQIFTDWQDGTLLKLNYDENMLGFSFVGLNYSQPRKNQYMVQLEGFDKDWVPLGNNNTLTYTNLDAGSYTFKVKASNNDGVWNETETIVKINIATAPWKTWWAYSLYLILIGSILYTMRRQTLQRIKVRNELATERLEKERVKYMNQLFTNISHDFRTPLTLIMSPLKQLVAQGAGDPRVQRQLQVMYKNAKSLMSLISQLLDLKKSESIHSELKISRQDIVVYLKEIKSFFDEYAVEKEINFQFESQLAEKWIWFDELQFQKVIYNLLSNAFKFTPAGGTIKLAIQESEGGDKVKIAVYDTGIGIPEVHKTMIFDHFYQVKSGNGTGIGLALVKNIVAMHQGTVEIESTENVGSCFTVTLPTDKLRSLDSALDDISATRIAEPMDFLMKKSKDFAMPSVPGFNEKRASILVVDDNHDLRQFISSLFDEHYNVYGAENGSQALEIARKKTVDIIVSDVMMPEMDGMEFCKLIKTDIQTSHIPVLLITAKTNYETERAGYNLGADAYITKPFDPELLIIRVHHLLESRKKLVEKYHREFIMQSSNSLSVVEVVSADEQFLTDFTGIVDKYLMDPDFSIDVVVKDIGMSRSVLYRKLKALTGQSIAEIIKTIRLKKAAQMLQTTNMTVSEVAFTLNFNDQKHFRQSFKALFNVLPSAYRKGSES